MTHELLVTPSQHSYARGAAIFTEGAESFGIPVSEAQTYEWSLLLQAAHDLDNILDSSLPKQERETRVDSIVADVVGEQTSDTDDKGCQPDCVFCELKTVASTWSDEHKVSLVEVALQAKEIAAARRGTVRARQLGKFAIYEGIITARLFSFNQSDGRAGITGYNSWLSNLLAAGTTFDTSIDLPKDYEDELTKVEPTATNRARLLAMGLPSLTRAIKATKPSLIRPLVGAVKSVTDDR